MNASQQLRAAICELDSVKIEELLRNGADPNEIIPGEDFPAIHLGAGTTKSITETLLYYGADPNLQTSDGSTPLHVAVSWGKSDILNTLLKYGADETIRDNENIAVTELAQYLEFWDCLNILQKSSKRQLKNQMKKEQKKYRLRRSADTPAQVKVNLHHDYIEVFTEELDRKSHGWNKDPFHRHERDRSSPVMSAFFRLPQHSDNESNSVTSGDTPSAPPSAKMKRHLKAGSTDPYFGTEIRNGSVPIEDTTNAVETESITINRQNRFPVENKSQEYSKNAAATSKDRETSYTNNSNQEVYDIRNSSCVDQCSSDETDARNRSDRMEYLTEPENVCRSIAKDGTGSDRSTVNFDTGSTLITTTENDVRSASRSRRRLDIEQIHADANDCRSELEEKEKEKNEDQQREELGDQVSREEEPRTENCSTNKKPVRKCGDSCECFRFCDQKLQIRIDLSFEPTKSENQNVQSSTFRNTERSQIYNLPDHVNRDCFERETGKEQHMASKKDTTQPDSACTENNNINYEFTEDALGNPVVRVDARISHELQSTCLDKNITKHNNNDCVRPERTQERSDSDRRQRYTNSVPRVSRSKGEQETHRKKRTCKLLRNLKKRFRKVFA